MIVRSLYYEPYENIMVDDNGEPFFDMFRIVSPSLFYYWKQVQGTYYVPIKNENIVYEFAFEIDGF